MIMARKIFRPMTVLVAVVAILIILVISKFRSTAKYTTVEIGSTKVKAEIAGTMAKQMQGLMFRQGIKENDGMLFVFDDYDYHSIWMMNMNFSIDIIWIKDGKIVDIYKNAQPCGISCPTYVPRSMDNYVLEVNSGFVEKHGIEVGDNVKIG